MHASPIALPFLLFLQSLRPVAGQITCGELWGGLEWLGLTQLQPNTIHELVRLIDSDGDGLLSLVEFRAAFAGDDEDEEPDKKSLQVSSSALAISLPPNGIAPKQIVELHASYALNVDADRDRRLRQLSKQQVGQIKVKAQTHTNFTAVWSSRGVGAHTDCGIWLPNVSLGIHKSNRMRLCVGHYVAKGLRDPARNSASKRLTLEVTDLGVVRLGSIGTSSSHLSTVVGKLFPMPVRWRQIWNTVGKRVANKHFFAWAAVPPSEDFVALGMVGTNDEEAPPLDALRCVPKRWCKQSATKPVKIWDDSGTGGRRGALWQIGSFGLLHVTNGHNPPTADVLWDLTSHRFMLDGSSKIWLPPELSGEGELIDADAPPSNDA